MGRVGRVGVVQDRFTPLDVGFEHGQFVQKVGLGLCVGQAGHGRGELVGKAWAVEQIRQARNRVGYPVRAQQPRLQGSAVGVERRVARHRWASWALMSKPQ